MIKLLIDENVALSIRDKLIEKGYTDTIHIDDIKKGIPDKEVFDIAQKESRIIISGDDDFKAKNFKYNCGIIWFTPSARLNIDIVEKIIWIIEHIDNYNINLYTSFISIKRNSYYIYYKQGMKGKLKEKEIMFNRVKGFEEYSFFVKK